MIRLKLMMYEKIKNYKSTVNILKKIMYIIQYVNIQIN